MSAPKSIGKREFIQHTSKYLKLVEQRGVELIITHQNRPDLILAKIKLKSLKELRGIAQVKVHGDVNEQVLPGYNEW